MSQKEPDYETIILLKLGVVEDLLKAFMASLAELPKKKGGGSTPVYARATGTIIWEEYVIRGEKIREGESLGIIETDKGPEWIHSPNSGFPFVLAEQGTTVLRGQKIAIIKKDRALV